MAAVGYTPISLYYSATPGAAPSASNLVNAELAINITDGKLYYKDNLGNVQLLASKTAAAGVTSFNTRTGAVTLSSSDVTTALGYTPVSTTGNETIAGVKTFSSNPTLSGGNANGVLYLNASKSAQSDTTFNYNGNALAIGFSTPNWQSSFSKALQLGIYGNAAIESNDGYTLGLLFGAVRNASNDLVATGGASTWYEQTSGTFTWYYAPYADTGNPLTYSQKMQLDSSGNLTAAGTISDSIGNVRSIPQTAASTNYILQLSDNGKHINYTLNNGSVEVPALGAVSAGYVATIFNNTNTTITIYQIGGSTLRQGGTTNTGNRTLSAYGVATILCVESNTYVITGTGLN